MIKQDMIIAYLICILRIARMDVNSLLLLEKIDLKNVVSRIISVEN